MQRKCFEKTGFKSNYLFKNKMLIFLSMVLSFFTMTIFVFFMYPLHTSSDELGTIASAAYLAGNNWESIINKGVGYYGTGYYFLFSPLFMVIKNPIIIYRVILLLNACTRVIIIAIAYKIAGDYFEIKDNKRKVLISTICSFAYTTRISTISNEYIIEVLIWMSIYFLCKLINNNDSKKKYIWLSLLIITTVYPLTIHTRGLVFLIAVVLVIVAKFLRQKQYKIVLFGVVVTTFLYNIVKKIVLYVQISIWNKTDELRNTTVSISDGIDIFNIKTWQLWLRMIVGQIGTMNIFTGGLFILVSITLFVSFIKILNTSDKMETLNTCLILTSTILVLCIAATIFAMLISNWFTGSFETFKTGNTGLNIYSYKGLTYLRYFEPYFSPLLLCSFSILDKKNKWNQYFKISVIVTVILQYIYIVLVLPLIKNNSAALYHILAISSYSFGDTVTEDNYFRAILLMLIALMIGSLVIKKHNINLYLLGMLFFFVYQYLAGIINYDIPVQTEMMKKVDGTYDLMMEIKKENLHLGKIYSYDDIAKDKNWSIHYVLQFYLNQTEIKINEIINCKETDVIVTNSKIEENLIPNIFYRSINIDENEIWYVFGEKTYKEVLNLYSSTN